MITFPSTTMQNTLQAWVTTFNYSNAGSLTIDIKEGEDQSVLTGEITLHVNDGFGNGLIEEWKRSGARIRYLSEDVWYDLGVTVITKHLDTNTFKFQSYMEHVLSFDVNNDNKKILEQLIENGKERVYEKTVFVFGAGASSDYLPNGNQLLYEMLCEKEDLDVVDFLKDFFGASMDRPANFPSFNQVLNLLEISLEREENLTNIYSLKKIRDLKEKMISSMRAYMIKIKPKENETYKNLLKSIKPVIDSGKKISLITFNYDLFLDLALKEIFEKNEIDYVLTFEKNEDKTSTKKPSIEVVKLHGSLDWMICPTCFFPMKYDDSKDTFINPICNEDKSPMQEFIYPPMQEKTQVHTHWMNLQARADELISNADRIVFIGFSLSDDDSLFRFKLKKKLYRRENPVAIQVIDQENTSISENWLAKHYNQYFGATDFRPIGFKKFAESPF